MKSYLVHGLGHEPYRPNPMQSCGLTEHRWVCALANDDGVLVVRACHGDTKDHKASYDCARGEDHDDMDR